MGKEIELNFRGKGVSQTKFTKSGQPKHAGNFSYSTIHMQSLQSKDYHVRRINGVLIVGAHTPLLSIFSEHVCEMAENPHFSLYVETGVKTVGQKKYEAERSLRRRFGVFKSWSYLDYEFIYREQIYTDNDFNYQFPEY